MVGSLRAEIAEWDLCWPYAPAVRSRNGISYLTARRFSAQNRLGSIQALVAAELVRRSPTTQRMAGSQHSRSASFTSS